MGQRIGGTGRRCCSPATADADGKAREDAQVAELTGLLRHSVGGDRYAT